MPPQSGICDGVGDHVPHPPYSVDARYQIVEVTLVFVVVAEHVSIPPGGATDPL